MERLFRRRQERRLRDCRSQIELDRAHEEKRPGEQQQTEEPPFAEAFHDACTRDNPPGASTECSFAGVMTVALVMNGHAYWYLFPNLGLAAPLSRPAESQSKGCRE